MPKKKGLCMSKSSFSEIIIMKKGSIIRMKRTTTVNTFFLGVNF